MPSRRSVYVDTETTGLDARIHQVVEVAWAVDGGRVQVVVPPHDLTHADPKALEVNRYFERRLYKRMLTEAEWQRARLSLTLDLLGAQLVGANPAFDAAMLTRLLGFNPWHHRLRDVEEKASTVFGWEDSRSLTVIAEELRSRGYAIPANDHTAAGDVLALRGCWRALECERTIELELLKNLPVEALAVTAD